jgi:hypothetical protein
VFSTWSAELDDPSPFLADLQQPFTLATNGEPARLTVHQLPDFTSTSGHIIAADAVMLLLPRKPFARQVPRGRHPLAVVVARVDGGERIAFAILRFSQAPAVSWEMAVDEDQNPAALKEGYRCGYGVDSGTGSFCDAAAVDVIRSVDEEGSDFSTQLIEQMSKSEWVHVESPGGSIAAFTSGYGDGSYCSYFGLDASGNPAALLTDFEIVNWRAPQP